jgi:hypothetical protein
MSARSQQPDQGRRYRKKQRYYDAEDQSPKQQSDLADDIVDGIVEYCHRFGIKKGRTGRQSAVDSKLIRRYSNFGCHSDHVLYVRR